MLFTHLKELEDSLKKGEVIQISMPSQALAVLVMNAEGKFCFIWTECFHGQNGDQDTYSFETLEELLLWIFACLFSQRMSRQDAKLFLCDSWDDSSLKKILSFTHE